MLCASVSLDATCVLLEASQAQQSHLQCHRAYLTASAHVQPQTKGKRRPVRLIANSTTTSRTQHSAAQPAPPIIVGEHLLAGSDSHLAHHPVSQVAVLLVDHGSRRAESNAMLEGVAALYRQHSGRDAVRIAHMEIAQPSILEAVTALARDGFKDIVLAPYFLSPGRHITQDIPALMAEAQRANPGIRCVLADPIGLDPLMAFIIEHRVASALARPTPGTAEVLEKE